MYRDKDNEMNTNRVIQEYYENCSPVILVSDTLPLSPSVSLFFSSRLGGVGDILLTFIKCQFELCVYDCVCVCVWVCLCVHVRGRAVCVCLSVVILHGSVHKSDYHKNTAENRLLIVLWVFPFCFLRKRFQQNNDNVHLCALHKPKWCIMACLAMEEYKCCSSCEMHQIKCIPQYSWSSFYLLLIDFEVSIIA